MTDEQAANRLLMQIEVGRKQLDQLGRQSQLIESAIQEIQLTLEALENIKGKNADGEILLPLGAGAYIRAKLLDTENIVLGVGANIYSEKKTPDAMEALNKRLKKLEESASNVRKTQGELAIRLSEMGSQAEMIMQKHPGN
jgi:prefoldin alpha subunit